MTVVATVEVPAEELLLGGVLSSDPRVQIEIEPAVPLGSPPAHYVWVTGGTIEAIDRAFRGATEVESFSVVETASERTLVRVTWNETADEFLELLAEAGGVVLEATRTADVWTIRLRFEEHDDLGAFFRERVRRDLSLDVRRVDNPGHSESGGPDGELTDAQRDTIRLAFEKGYFAVPREITLQELAAELDVSGTAVSQRIRRGIATLLSSGTCDLSATNESLSSPVVDHREVTPPFE
jgi:predicted DNA binding protein